MITTLTAITLILVLAIVAVVAFHLISTFIALKRSGDHLAALAGGLVQIQQDTAPLNARVDEINGSLKDLVAPLSGAGGNLAAIVKVAGEIS